VVLQCASGCDLTYGVDWLLLEIFLHSWTNGLLLYLHDDQLRRPADEDRQKDNDKHDNDNEGYHWHCGTALLSVTWEGYLIATRSGSS